MFLLDTNVVSAIRVPSKADPNVLAWMQDHDAGQHLLSVVTIFELEVGALRVGRRDPAQGAIYRTWINRLLVEFEGRILDYSLSAARQCAALHVPDPKPERDAMIGATALVHDLTLVTRNVTDFASMGVRLLNPWDTER